MDIFQFIDKYGRCTGSLIINTAISKLEEVPGDKEKLAKIDTLIATLRELRDDLEAALKTVR